VGEPTAIELASEFVFAVAGLPIAAFFPVENHGSSDQR
jgi:hypothetical protein